MATSMPRHRHDKQIFIQSKEVLPIDQFFRVNSSRIRTVDDAPALAEFVDFLVVSNVVTMREDHEGNTTQFLQLPYERSGEPGRVNQDVSLRTQNDIRRCAVGIGGCEAAKVDVLLDQFRICRGGRLNVDFAACSNRSCGTSDQSHSRSVRLDGSLWLAINDGVIVVFRKHRRGNLPAQIAVDASVVYKERSGDILPIGALRIRHTTIVGEFPRLSSRRTERDSKILPSDWSQRQVRDRAE